MVAFDQLPILFQIMQVEASSRRLTILGAQLQRRSFLLEGQVLMDWKGNILCRLKERDGHNEALREVVENCE